MTALHGLFWESYLAHILTTLDRHRQGATLIAEPITAGSLVSTKYDSGVVCPEKVQHLLTLTVKEV